MPNRPALFRTGRILSVRCMERNRNDFTEKSCQWWVGPCGRQWLLL